MTKDDIETFVKDFLLEYKGNIPLELIVAGNQEEIYGRNNSYEKTGQRIEGAYHPSRNIFTLVTSHIRDVQHLRTIVRHEILGHYGLNTLAPIEKMDLLNAVLETKESKNKELNAIWNKVETNYSGKSDLIKAEEVFAFVAEDQRTFSVQAWDKVRACFNAALRRIGLSNKTLTLSELRVAAQSMSEGIKNGNKTQQTFPKSDLEQFRVSSNNKKYTEESIDMVDNKEKVLAQEPINKSRLSEQQDEENIEAVKIGANPKKPIPEELNKKYVIEGNNEKGKYYFKENPEVEAFRDKGEKIIAKSTASSVAKSMVDLAEAKQWESIKLSGTKEFRREVWMEASVKGMNVTGYEPTDQDKQNLENRLNKIEGQKDQTLNSIEQVQDTTDTGKMAADAKENSTNVDKLPLSTADAKVLEMRDRIDAQFKEGEQKNVLKDSYLNLSKEEAIKKHPQLEPLYNLEKAANDFTEHGTNKGKFNDKTKAMFVSAVRDKGIETLNKGEKLPTLNDRPVATDRTPQKEAEISR
jgi:hypothetical protein